MTADGDDVCADEESLVRPFLPGGGGHRAGTPPVRPAAWFEPLGVEADRRPDGGGTAPARLDQTAGATEVRPYLLTGGRTRPRATHIALETVVLATGVPPPWAPAAAGRERERILQLAVHPCSAAEVAARLELPLGVALVLVADLVAEGLLDARQVASHQAEDVDFLERLIAGVAAL